MAVWDTTRRPSSQRVGAFRLGSMLLALHQAGDRFNDPDGNGWILQERPGRIRWSTVQRRAAGGRGSAADAFACLEAMG